MAIALVTALLVIICGRYLRLRRRRTAELQHNHDLVATNHKLSLDLAHISVEQKMSKYVLHEWIDFLSDVDQLAFQYKDNSDNGISPDSVLRTMRDWKKGLKEVYVKKAREYLLLQPGGKNAVELLTDSDLLLIILTVCKLPTKDIVTIIGAKPSRYSLYFKRIEVVGKLINAGMSPDHAKSLIFQKYN